MQIRLYTSGLLATTFLFIMALGGVGCQGSANKTKETLVGQWVIQNALREDQPTETLNGAYFSFDPSGTMHSNLPLGAQTPVPFTLKDNELTQQSEPPVVYTIQSFTDSVLVLHTVLQNTPFEITLRRGVPETVPTSTMPPQEGVEIVNDTVR